MQWKPFLDRFFSGRAKDVKKFHLFRFSKDHPGFVFCYERHDDKESVKVRLVRPDRNGRTPRTRLYTRVRPPYKQNCTHRATREAKGTPGRFRAIPERERSSRSILLSTERRSRLKPAPLVWSAPTSGLTLASGLLK